MNYLSEIFRVREQNLKNLYELKVKHNPSDGRFREDLVKTVLDVIPQRYKVKNGFIIDSEGNLSDEMDLIIYDDVYVPHFFMETYSLIPIESVVAVIQVKTTLTGKELKSSIKNLDSIDRLKPKKGGKIISAANGLDNAEKRFIAPLKILVSGSTSIKLSPDKLSSIDIVYSIATNENDQVLVKEIEIESMVSISLDLTVMQEMRKANTKYKVNKNSKLFRFYMAVLTYLTLINNSMIINYSEYNKGGLENE